MKILALICSLFVIICLESCGGNGVIKNKSDDTASNSAVVHSKVPVPNATANSIVKDVNDIPGYWVGKFGPEVNGADTIWE